MFTYATKDQVVESLKRLAIWNHHAILLARAIYDRDGEWWLRDTYICLLLENARVFRLLNHAMGLEEPSIAALAARNALEMKVWILYANADEKNARRLYDDQMVDAREMMKRIEALLMLVPNDQRPAALDSAMEESRRVLEEKGPEFGVTEDDRYLRTHALAQQVGCGDECKGMFPILSKLLHPTGISMFHGGSGPQGEHTLVHACSVGIHYFANNIDTLNAHLKAKGFPYIHQDGDRLQIRTQ